MQVVSKLYVKGDVLCESIHSPVVTGLWIDSPRISPLNVFVAVKITGGALVAHATVAL